jgi:hypothetical protein
MKGPYGSRSVKTTVDASAAVTDAMRAPRSDGAIGRARSKLKTTAAASSEAPSWKRTPVRSVKRYVRPSAAISHRSASFGTTRTLPGARSTSGS